MSAFRNASYLLLAEFDILLGSQLNYEYPQSTNIKPSMLAELMLPEGAHARESDWTTFFINPSMVSDWTREQEEIKEKERIREEKRRARELANNQSNNQSVNQSNEQSNEQSNNQSNVETSQSKSTLNEPEQSADPANESNNQSNNQITNQTSSTPSPELDSTQSINQAVDRSTNQSPAVGEVLQTESQSVDQSANQTTDHSINESTLHSPSNNQSTSSSNKQWDDPLSNLAEGEQLCVLNLCRTKRDASVKRGAYVKSLCLVTPLKFYSVFRPLLMVALNTVFEVAGVPVNSATSPDQTVDPVIVHQKVWKILEDLFDCINQCQFPDSLVNQSINQSINRSASLPWRLYQASRMRLAAGGSDAETDTITCVANYRQFNNTSINQTSESSTSQSNNQSNKQSVMKFNLKLPRFMSPDETHEASLTTLIASLQSITQSNNQSNQPINAIMALYQAVLCEKRVLFLGYGKMANEMCQLVLSTLLLVSPPLIGSLRRAFPYASLVNTSFLQVPGYIAGVTNPIFDKPDWYDLCINLTDQTINYSPAYLDHLSNNQTINQSINQSALDSAFYAELSHGQTMKYGEEWTRCMFRDLTTHIYSIATGKAVFVNSQAEKLQVDAQHYRVEQLKSSDAFIQLQVMKQKQRNLEEQSINQSNNQSNNQTSNQTTNDDTMPWHHIEDLVIHHVRTLQIKSTSPAETSDVISDLNRLIDSEMAILEFLCLMPETQGALMPIGMLLFHVDQHVRKQAFELLNRIDQSTEGSKWIGAMSYFVLVNYYHEFKKLKEAAKMT